MTKRKPLPGNPYDPNGAYKSGKDHFTDEVESDWVSDLGMTDATLLANGIKQLTHAVMAVAYELRTANMLAGWELLGGTEPDELALRLGLGGEGND